jgi:hypothetical protein
MNPKDNFVFQYKQEDIDEIFCKLTMSRVCRNPSKYVMSPTLTRIIDRMRKSKVQNTKFHFEKELPPLYTPYHISINDNVPYEKEEELRDLRDIHLHPTIQYNVTGVEGGICVCTTNDEDRQVLLNIIRGMNIPESYIYLWDNMTLPLSSSI